MQSAGDPQFNGRGVMAGASNAIIWYTPSKAKSSTTGEHLIFGNLFLFKHNVACSGVREGPGGGGGGSLLTNSGLSVPVIYLWL